MRKRIFKIAIVLFLIAALWIFLRFVIGGPEDDWICVDGQWVKHGNPRAPMPTEGCGQQLNLEKKLPEPKLPEPKLPEPKLPDIILLEVPFTSQAPFAQWSNPVFQNACEEASLLMAILWVRGVKLISKEEATAELNKFADFEIEKYNNYYDHSAADTAQIMRDYWGYNDIEVKENIKAEDIINQLLSGNLVIVPVDGRALGNPYYTPPGPEEHMLVIIGYDFETKEFITNDVGTRHGEKYHYKKDILEQSIRDYPTGYKEPITEIKKTMIVIKK